MSLRLLLVISLFYVWNFQAQSLKDMPFDPHTVLADSLSPVADSLTDLGMYTKIIAYRKKAMEVSGNREAEYQNMLRVKFHMENAYFFENTSYSYHDKKNPISILERQRNLDSAIAHSLQAKYYSNKLQYPDIWYRYVKIYNRLYLEAGYRGDWKMALKEAKEGLKVLRDTLSEAHRRYATLIYDIGYINAKVGDFTEAVRYYEKSLNLYKKILGKFHPYVGQSYVQIASEYRNLGLRKKELESLQKALEIFREDRMRSKDLEYLFKAYRDLFNWYSYYGDFGKAADYQYRLQKLFKKEQIHGVAFLRNDDETHAVKIAMQYDLMMHNLRMKDTITAQSIGNTIVKTYKKEKKLLKEEADVYPAVFKSLSEVYKKTDPEKSMAMLNRAIEIQERYQNIHYTNPLPFKVDKLELLLDIFQIDQARKLAIDLKKSMNNEKNFYRFRITMLLARLAELTGNSLNAENLYNTAFVGLQINPNIPLEKLRAIDLKPIVSFETIDAFIRMGDFYRLKFIKTTDSVNLKKAFHRYLIASEYYNKLYLGNRYNDNLYKTFVRLNGRLLNVANTGSDTSEFLIETLNQIEKNGSKLIWSKYKFNNGRRLINASDKLLSDEEVIKAQLNFYRKKLYTEAVTDTEKHDLWKEKIIFLEKELARVQDSIKHRYTNYFHFNLESFDIKKVQKALDSKTALVKYVFTNKDLFAFLIRKEKIELYKLGAKEEVRNRMDSLIASIQRRDFQYPERSKQLKRMIITPLHLSGSDHITFVPDGFLYRLPFEALLYPEQTPVVSYAASLQLFNEHRKNGSNAETITMAAFTAGSGGTEYAKPEMELQFAEPEIRSVLKIFDGKAFINSSKSTFLVYANDYDILHFAMHTTLNYERPELSSLNFYGNNAQNRLSISELYNTSLQAKMVVLSACDTGNGYYQNGEGIISLSRAFTYAGVPSNVMSLWQIPDKESARIMRSFYGYLKKGFYKDEALRQAKLDYLKQTDDEILRNPYFWAGFIVSGDTSPLVQQPKKMPKRLWIWGAAGIIIMFLAIGKRINLF